MCRSTYDEYGRQSLACVCPIHTVNTKATHLHDREHAPGVGAQADGEGVGDEVVVLGGGRDGQQRHQREPDLVEGRGLGDLVVCCFWGMGIMWWEGVGYWVGFVFCLFGVRTWRVWRSMKALSSIVRVTTTSAITCRFMRVCR